MRLYEIDEAIEELCLKLTPDPETGEVLMSEDVLEELGRLQMERKTKLEYLAKLALNCRAEAAAIKEEEQRLAKRRKRLEDEDKRIVGLLDRECAGVKTDLGVATLSYRKNPASVSIVNTEEAIKWLTVHGHNDCITIPAPEISKAAVKPLLMAGETVPGLELVSGTSCSLR